MTPSWSASHPITPGKFSTGVAVGSGVDVDNRVNFTPQAESASPAEVTPANLRKSLRENLFLFILEKS
jgi:hypothetical protein